MTQQKKQGFGTWGWLLLLFGLIMFLFSGGFVVDGTNVIAPAVAQRLDVDRGVILSMNSVAGIVGVLVAVVAGQLNQRLGARVVASGCLIVAAIGHIAACNAVNVGMYLAAMCFVSGGLSAGSFVGVGTLVAMWFPKKQGQAMSVVAMGSNFCTMLFVPLLTALNGAFGISVTSLLCGGAALVVGLLGAALLRNSPSERGLYPDNVTEAEFRTGYAVAPPETDPHGWTVGKLLRTKETWLCIFSTGLLMLTQNGVMSQLVSRNMELGMELSVATGVMSVIAVVGVIGSLIFGRIVVSLGVKRAGVLTGVLYIVAMLLNVSGIMPLVWVSLVIIGLLTAAAPNLMNSIPGSVFGRLGYAKVNSVVFPLTNVIFMLNFAVNGVITILFHSLRVAYIVFAVLSLIAVFLILAIQDHKYDQDYMAAYKQ